MVLKHLIIYLFFLFRALGGLFLVSADQIGI